MNLALSFSGVARPALPGWPLAVVAIAVVAGLLPIGGYSLPAGSRWSWDVLAVLRLGLLAAGYSLTGLASYQRTRDGWASAAAILLGAAVGWAGWEWSAATIGWSIFGALVLLLERLEARRLAAITTLAIGWALLDQSAAVGALLLAAHAVSRRDEPLRARLWLLVIALLCVATLVLRGVDVGAVVAPSARSWVWADGQAANTPGDPIGFTLFMGMLAFLGLWILRSGRPARTDLVVIGVFVYLTWYARRHGVWLGLAAAPTLAACLTGGHERWDRITRAGAMAAGAGGLLLALIVGPTAIGGQPFSAHVIAGLPSAGILVYRPPFEPMLRRSAPLARLHLASAAAAGPAEAAKAHEAWLRIETNCSPADELDRLRAEVVVLDPRADTQTIATLTSSGAWHVGAADQYAVVLRRGGT